LVWDVITTLPQEQIVLSVSKPPIGICKKSKNVVTEKQMPPLKETEKQNIGLFEILCLGKTKLAMVYCTL
jgi:hypothetical protein